MTRLTRIAVLLVVTPLALLAACSDGDDDATEAAVATEAVSESRLTEEAWTAAVDDLCIDHNDALGRIIGPLFADGPPTDDEAQAAAEEVVERTRSVTDEIDALVEPSALTIHVAALVAALDAGSDQVEAVGGSEFFASKVDPFRRAADIAGEMGLEACDTEG